MNRLVFALLFVTAPVAAQVTIDSHGIRSGGTTIDARGVRTGGTSVDAGGIHARDGVGGRVISGNHTTQRVDCGGGALTVNGNHNDLTVANCRSVTVAGNHNLLTARFVAPGRLTVVGNNDRVTYSSAPRVSVAVSNVGTRSTVTRR